MMAVSALMECPGCGQVWGWTWTEAEFGPGWQGWERLRPLFDHWCDPNRAVAWQKQQGNAPGPGQIAIITPGCVVICWDHDAHYDPTQETFKELRARLERPMFESFKASTQWLVTMSKMKGPPARN